MHQYIVNASLQILPIVHDKHPYIWVDEAIEVIRQSNIKYEVGAFSTTLEGKYSDVMKVLDAVNNYLQKNGCAEWIANVQIQIRTNSDITGDEKTIKFKS